ncbi:MAG: HAMP domain-containing histidine kinase [Bacteroidales bacterium]|nr:HAMP domain-containing histidine kinase [Bacteroidales bacterium]
MEKQKIKVKLRSGRLNFVLISISTVIVAVTLFFSRMMVEQIKREEKVRIQNWAISTQRQISMANRIRSIFSQMETEERQYATIWTYVYERVFSPASPTPKDFDFLMRIMSSNRRPFILVDRFGKIIESHDPEINLAEYPYFNHEIQERYAAYPPIMVDAQGILYHLYFKPSEVFLNLQHLFADLDNSFSEESVNSMAAITVPVIITDESQTVVLGYCNIEPSVFYSQESIRQRLKKMQGDNAPIEMRVPGMHDTVLYLFYESSAFLRKMRVFTFAILLTLLASIGGGLILLNLTKKVEQNREWWGMSKETAHQLGTPLSSLLAWVDFYKTKDGEPMAMEDLAEIEKDVKRIELVTNRFSKIGSVPELTWENVVPVVYKTVTYLRARTSTRIEYTVNVPEDTVMMAQINAPLIEWVLENLFKNALNAIQDNKGRITISLTETAEHVMIDVEDTGKGMPKSMFTKIFEPGYTTKQRGWGLGLTLSRRIVENYHKGKIFVKSSTQSVGTVFRVVLNKECRKK